MIRSLVISALFALSAGSAAASAVASAPSLKPERQYTSNVTDEKNAKILHKALKAYDNKAWSTLSSLQRQATDPDVKNLILWIRASNGVPGMSFDELSYAIETLPEWPRTNAMQNRAEEIIGGSTLSAKERITWLTKNSPRTGTGKVQLADAYWSTGKKDKARELARDAWITNTLDRSEEKAVLSRYGSSLTQADHQARVEFLLWTNQRSAAVRLKPKLSSGYQKLVDARIALATRRSNVDSKISAVPNSLKDNPGLLYERARWRRLRARNQDGATSLLANIDGAEVPAAGRNKLWKERNIALRSDLKDGNWARAYSLASPHGMNSGGGFAEAEWVSGWIALRLNDDAERALGHFDTMAKGVSTPISQSRGDYWKGRAADVLKETDTANAAYQAAAEHKYTYYGQLAAERMNDRSFMLKANIEPTDAEIEAFEARPLVKALRLLGETTETGMFRRFAYHLDDQLTNEADFTLLSRIAEEYQAPDIGVRGAKAGMAKGIVAADAAYPVVNYPLLREPKVERPLMLALSRQESEMNPNAISHVGARGLMQFMPATARNEARLRGLPYRKSWLTDDPGYNMTLGGQHLDTLLGQFNGSYIMTAAAYNAGPSRPKQWVKDYGDPRTGQIDPIDWVEFIPFSETRNYVQRVLENTQIYRQRLSGEEGEIRLSEDLQRGEK